ncbi:MAG: alkaline phosphatase D family protein [Betaproteobacteria bacterium]|nr:alkaline phosphatase D family protein [Betaproteobacteria bacterium]
MSWSSPPTKRFRNVVRRGTGSSTPTSHSVHVQASALEPSRWYWYRFTAGGQASAAGRTRTAPAPGREEALAFAIASCQRYDGGHYAAWRHLAAEAPDLVVFLGDHIYESAPRKVRVRTHSGTGAAKTLDDYRARYAQYKSDADLQRIHASAPWILTWDDHEVQNDYANDRGQDLAPDFLARRAAAYRAWWGAHADAAFDAAARSDLRVHDRYDWGIARTLPRLDDRQYRDAHACPPPGRGGSTTVNVADCPDLLRADRTILGGAQERWLEDGLAQRDVRWNLIAQQTLMAPFPWTKEGRYWTDGWAGSGRARPPARRHRRAQRRQSGRAVRRRALQLRLRHQAPRRRPAGRGDRERVLRHVDRERRAASEPRRGGAAAQPARQVRPVRRARLRRAEGRRVPPRRVAARRERRRGPEGDDTHRREVQRRVGAAGAAVCLTRRPPRQTRRAAERSVA